MTIMELMYEGVQEDLSIEKRPEKLAKISIMH